MEIPLTEQHSKVLLTTQLEMTYFSLVMSFVEESATAFGLDASGTLKLRLACEEIFTYLTGSDQEGKTIAVESENGGYYVGVKFLFEARDFDPHAFNLTAKPSPESEAGFAGMGLLIASRSVDRLEMLYDSESGFGVSLLKEKTYPVTTDIVKVSVKELRQFSVGPPDGETLKFFVRQAAAYYPPHLYPTYFQSPGRVLDMVATGRYRALVASSPEARAAGGIVWRFLSPKLIEIFGPYLFGQPGDSGMAETLVEEALAAVAKTEAVGVIDIFATPELPRDYFELLGSLDYSEGGGEVRPWPYYFRHLKEDPGSRVFAHRDLLPFLEKEYSRLFLARQIVSPTYEGEGRPLHSVFSPRFNRQQSLVVIRFVWDGADAGNVLADHVEALAAEGFKNILFEMDLAYPWQTDLTPALIAEGFDPRLVLPYAGSADILVFERNRER